MNNIVHKMRYHERVYELMHEATFEIEQDAKKRYSNSSGIQNKYYSIQNFLRSVLIDDMNRLYSNKHAVTDGDIVNCTIVRIESSQMPWLQYQVRYGIYGSLNRKYIEHFEAVYD